MDMHQEVPDADRPSPVECGEDVEDQFQPRLDVRRGHGVEVITLAVVAQRH